MAATEYTDPKTYIPFSNNDNDCGCGKEDCDECSSCGNEDDCSCCPVGLVSIQDDNGTNIGCLTPNDAELFEKNTFKCNDGYVKLMRNSTGEFLGCVTEANFPDLYTQVNP